MRQLTAAFLLLALACTPLLAQDETAPEPPSDNALSELNNPLVDAAEGEWIEYTMTTENPMMGKMEIPISQTVLGVDGEEVRISTIVEVMGAKQEQTSTERRDGSLLDALLSNLSQMGETENVTVVESSVEDSTLEYNGETYDTKKVFISATATVVPGPNMEIPITIKLTAHVSEKVPVSGVLSLQSDVVMTMQGQKMEMQTLQTTTDFGFEPKGDEKEEDKEPSGEF